MPGTPTLLGLPYDASLVVPARRGGGSGPHPRRAVVAVVGVDIAGPGVLDDAGDLELPRRPSNEAGYRKSLVAR